MSDYQDPLDEISKAIERLGKKDDAVLVPEGIDMARGPDFSGLAKLSAAGMTAREACERLAEALGLPSWLLLGEDGLCPKCGEDDWLAQLGKFHGRKCLTCGYSDWVDSPPNLKRRKRL